MPSSLSLALPGELAVETRAGPIPGSPVHQLEKSAVDHNSGMQRSMGDAPSIDDNRPAWQEHLSTGASALIAKKILISVNMDA